MLRGNKQLSRTMLTQISRYMALPGNNELILLLLLLQILSKVSYQISPRCWNGDACKHQSDIIFFSPFWKHPRQKLMLTFKFWLRMYTGCKPGRRFVCRWSRIWVIRFLQGATLWTCMITLEKNSVHANTLNNTSLAHSTLIKTLCDNEVLLKGH